MAEQLASVVKLSFDASRLFVSSCFRVSLSVAMDLPLLPPLLRKLSASPQQSDLIFKKVVTGDLSLTVQGTLERCLKDLSEARAFVSLVAMNYPISMLSLLAQGKYE